MHDFPYPSYLRTHRERWTLTQAEFGALLDIAESAVSRYEKLQRTPSVRALIGAEFIFGVHARRIFPGMYASVEFEISKVAGEFAEALAHLDAEDTAVKRQLLEEIALRIAGEQLNV